MIGSEPTFTNARSQLPCWLTDAEGGEKEAHAHALLRALAPRLDGPVQMLRVPGRLYPGETEARWCIGALFSRYPSRDKTPLGDARHSLGEIRPAPTPTESQAWLTITPDPGVVEINAAPAHDLATFARWAEHIYAAAAEAGLAPTRFRYNGELLEPTASVATPTVWTEEGASSLIARVDPTAYLTWNVPRVRCLAPRASRESPPTAAKAHTRRAPARRLSSAKRPSTTRPEAIRAHATRAPPGSTHADRPLEFPFPETEQT